MECAMCGIELVTGEAKFCMVCQDFIVWKYGSLEAFDRAQFRALKADGGETE